MAPSARMSCCRYVLPALILLALFLTPLGRAQPANDSEIAALLLCSGSTPFSTVGATDDRTPSCGPMGKDIWYKYRPSASGTLQVSTCGANFDTVLAAYDATLNGQLTQIVCNDDTCGVGSTISFAVVAGRPRANFYIIRVGGYLGASGSGTLQVNGPDCDATNDDCALATPLCPGTTRYSTIGAMSEYSLPCQVMADVWFVYAPAASGSVTIDTCAAASYDTMLAAYSGFCSQVPLMQEQLACNDDFCFFTRSSITFSVIGGRNYWIRVGGFNGATGTGTLTLAGPACGGPVNDLCTAAIDVSAGGTFQGTVAGANNDGASACIFPVDTGCDVWYRFTAPNYAVRLTVDTCGSYALSGIDTITSIFSGCPGTPANEFDCHLGPALCGFPDSTSNAVLNPGQTADMRVSSFGVDESDGRFVLHVGYAPPNDACANAIALTAPGLVLGNLTHATNDGSASCGSSNANRDLWYSYTATCAGTLTVDTCGTNDFPKVDHGMDTVLSMTTACPGGIGLELACNDDTPLCQGAAGLLRDSQVSQHLNAGQTVYIRVSYFNTSIGPGEFRLHTAFSSNCACPCDHNVDGHLNSQDFFDFLQDFFELRPAADYNGNGVINSQDFFDFLGCFFGLPTGCG